MITSKYAADYRLENVLNPKTGKLVTKAVYRGDWFRYIKPAELVHKRKILFTILTTLIVVLYVSALLLTGITERNTNVKALDQLYVILPFVGIIFPVCFLITAVYRAWRVGDQLTREQKDRITGRFAATSLIIMILSGISLIGHIVSWVLNGETATDLALLGFTAVICAAAAAMFFLKNGFSTEKCGTARIE